MSEWLRELQNSELWQDKPFAKGQAWIDMVLSAERKEDGWYFSFSERGLAAHWGWSNTKVTNFMRYLEQQGKIQKRQSERQKNGNENGNKNGKRKTTIKLLHTRVCEDFQNTKNGNENGNKNGKKTAVNSPAIIDAEHDSIPDSEIYKRIVDYLNNRCGTNYKYTTQTTKKSIHARLAEGFTEEDFYTVIDKKTNEWIGTEMERYLTPTTLFSGKFEGYLNQVIVGSRRNRSPSNSRDEKFSKLLEQIRRDDGYED